MNKKDISKITDECKLTGVGYDTKEEICYRIAQFDDGAFGFIETVSGVRKEHRIQSTTSAGAVIGLNKYLNGDGNLPQVAQENVGKKVEQKRVAPTRDGMTVSDGKAYLEERGLESLVIGGFKTIQRMQQGTL